MTQDLAEGTPFIQKDSGTQFVETPSRASIETMERERCTTTSSSTPVQVSSLSNGAAIAAGADHSIAATSPGAAWDWGNNQYGQLGNGNTSNTSTPIQVSSLSSIQSQTNASYAYNGDGLRMSKTVNGTAEAFSWDLAEGLPLMLQDGSTQVVDGPGGMPIEQIDASGTVTYLYQDQLGSTRVLTDSSGNVVGTYSYDAFGTTTSHTGTASTPLQFAGQYLDSETGLYYLQARYYDPSTAQFINVDPLVSQTQQPYSYAWDNPLNVTDPTGLCAGRGHPRCGRGGNFNAGTVWNWAEHNPAALAAAAGVAALVVALVGPKLVAAGLTLASLALGAIAVARDMSRGDWQGAVYDIGSEVAGLIGFGYAIKAFRIGAALAAHVPEIVDAFRSANVVRIIMTIGPLTGAIKLRQAAQAASYRAAAVSITWGILGSMGADLSCKS